MNEIDYAYALLETRYELVCAERNALCAKLDALQKQEPVVWMQSDHLSKFINNHCGSESMMARCSNHQLHSDHKPLYATPTPPSVPSAKQLSDHKSAAYVLGWNECRAAMIQATPKPGEKE